MKVMNRFASAKHKMCTFSTFAARTISRRTRRAIRPTCSAAGRRRGEASVKEILTTTIAAVVRMKAVRPCESERVIVDTTVQEKATAYPTDNCSPQIAQVNLARLAQRAGLEGSEVRVLMR
jgi:hypothetical protein